MNLEQIFSKEVIYLHSYLYFSENFMNGAQSDLYCCNLILFMSFCVFLPSYTPTPSSVAVSNKVACRLIYNFLEPLLRLN